MWLTVRTGADAGKTVEIAPGRPFVVGRGEEADLTLDDRRASRKHAELTVEADGGAQVRDLGSGNGTFVNGDRVESFALEGEEQLQFGDTVAVLSRTDPASGGGAATVLGSAQRSRTQSALHRLVVERSVRRVTALSAAAVLAALVVGILLLTGVIGGGSDASQKAVERVVGRAAPATVLIEGRRPGRPATRGSGWVLDAHAGLLVTNAHVINDGESFRAGPAGGLRPATVVAAAPCEDLAVLRVRDTTGLRTLPLGSQSALKLGQTVVALGYPETASERADLASTSGVVSVARSSYREPAVDIPLYPNVVQTDAAINPGNSGGPLLDLRGRLVGVNSAGRTISPDGRIIQGQNYAIGVDRVRSVVQTLRQGRSLGWTGAGFDYGAGDATSPGLVFGRAVKGTAAAAAAGLAGATLVEVDHTPLARSLASYCDAVRGLRSGATVTLSVLPRGSASTREVRLRLE